MRYDSAVIEAECFLDDEFDSNFKIFDDCVAGEDKVTIALMNWNKSSGKKKQEYADDLESALRDVKRRRTARLVDEKAEEIMSERGGRKENGMWI